jgi:hypothetical protein
VGKVVALLQEVILARVLVRFTLLAVLSCTLAAPALPANLVPGTSCPVFPSDSWWHADVSKLPVHGRSVQWLARMSPAKKLHPDFGPSFGEQPAPYGIPITVVNGSHATVPVTFDYADESDAGPYPLGQDTKVEGGQFTSGDRHTVIVNSSTCRLYETWATRKSGDIWLAGSGATWKLTSNALRRSGWTSADAAGLPILPGLLRYDEVVARSIDHAIRFTTDETDSRFIWPARHQAGSASSQSYPPMGARFRLKADYAFTGPMRADTRAVVAAMKKYGLVLADNGSPWFFQGTADARWPSGLLDQLKLIPASAFEAVDTSSLKIAPNSMQVSSPPIGRPAL